jgi:hypothetical protein
MPPVDPSAALARLTLAALRRRGGPVVIAAIWGTGLITIYLSIMAICARRGL